MSEITITFLSWDKSPLLKLKKKADKGGNKKKREKAKKRKFLNHKMHLSSFQKQSQLHEEKVKFLFL